MPWSVLDIPLALPAFALVLFRLTGLMITAPIFGSRIIPARVRGALLLATAAMIFPVVQPQAPAQITLATVLVGGVGEMIVGLTIGLSLSILLMGASLAGQIVGQQAGIALGQVFDPTRNAQSSIVGQVYTIVLTLTFLIAGGHRAAIAALLDTFHILPVLSFHWDDSILILLVEMLTSAFVLGIRLAGPVLIAMFLTAIAMGFLARTMPQLNILSVGFTVRILVALGTAALALSAGQDFLLHVLWDAVEAIRMSLGLAPRPLGW